MKGVLAHRETLGPEGVIALLNTEQRRRVGQEVTLHPAQRQWIGYGMPLDHVSENHHVDIGAQKRGSVAFGDPQGFGEAPLGEVQS